MNQQQPMIENPGMGGPPPQTIESVQLIKNASWTSRHRKLLITIAALVILATLITIITLSLVKPWGTGNTDPSSENSSAKSSNSTTTPVPKFNKDPTQKGNQLNQVLAADAQCNQYTPPINQPFQYGVQPIRGVNLGGWFVLEPFITPSLFDPYVNQGVVDEYTLSKYLGPEKMKALLTKHYSTWVTEDTFKRIKDLGLNHVRIPLGFWALGNLTADEPYIPDLALDYLLQGLKWAAKYGLRAMVELHGAPGSQNGWNHSGRAGKIGWLDGTPQGFTNGNRTTTYDMQLATLLAGPGFEHVVPMFGILNEPAIFLMERKFVDQWYKQTFAALREATKNPAETGGGSKAGPWAVIHEGFLGLDKWEGFMPGSDRLALDVHQYMIFDHDLVRFPRDKQVAFSCDVWAINMQHSTKNFGPTLVGEFSSAANDCATYLNGVGVGARWDGTFDKEDATPACADPSPDYCSCSWQNNMTRYDASYKKFLLDYTQVQMDAFEQGLGWFYWNFKTENNALWSYFDGVDQGWIPKDANNRPGGCTAIGKPLTPPHKVGKKDADEEGNGGGEDVEEDAKKVGEVKKVVDVVKDSKKIKDEATKVKEDAAVAAKKKGAAVQAKKHQ